MEHLKTGELAKRAGVNIETLRFYEREGLIPEPPRRMSGYREYPAESVQLIRFIKRAQELGFSLREVRELLALRVESGTTCADVRQKAHEKVLEVRQKIADLQAIERALWTLTATCSGEGPLTECPILDCLDGTTNEEGSHHDNDNQAESGSVHGGLPGLRRGGHARQEPGV